MFRRADYERLRKGRTNVSVFLFYVKIASIACIPDSAIHNLRNFCGYYLHLRSAQRIITAYYA